MSSLKRLIAGLVTGIRHFIHGIGFLIYGMLQTKSVNRTINCHPRTPLPLYTLWNMAQVCGFKLKDYSENTQGTPTMLFQDKTTIASTSLPKDTSTWINGRCRDIQKSTVAKIFTRVTHRDLLVNPREYKGRIVEKSEENPAHDGRIFEGPLLNHTPIPGRVYQRLIDNTLSESNEVEDLRTVIVGSTIPLVYRIRRSIDARFEGYGSHTTMATANEVFSQKEQEELIECAKQIGLDFGEMDVLRDREEQRIYIVDINKTTISPPANLSFQERVTALQRVGKAFEAELWYTAANGSP